MSREDATRFEINALHMVDPTRCEARALTRRSGERLKGSAYTTLYDNGAAALDIHGPVFRHADSMETSGAMSTEAVFGELKLIRASNNVKAVALHFDCPGGDVCAADTVAYFIREMAKEKRVEAYIEGHGASLAYYWASATSRITQGRYGQSGSIGVVIGVPLAQAKTKFGDNVLFDVDGTPIAEIVSSVSPLKRADANTEEGHKYFLDMVNGMADELVADVSLFRGIEAAKLPAQYGDGGVYKGSDALRMGLCDEVGSFEVVLDRLVAADWERGRSMTGASGTEPEPVEPPDGNPVPDVDPADDLDPEAQNANGGDDVSLKEKMKKARAGLAAVVAGDTGQEKPGASAEDGEPKFTTAEALATLNAQRPAVFESYEDAAALFGVKSVTQSKVWPAAQDQFAGVMANAKADDTLYGGKVTYINSEGEEAEGTREEMVAALVSAIPTHTLAQERVVALQRGDTQGNVLKNSSEKPTARTADSSDMGDDDMSDEDILKTTEQGRAILAERKKAGANGNNGTRA